MDPLYSIFEQHLFNALVEEETNEEFLTRVVADYMDRLKANGTLIAREHMDDIRSDLREEVFEMLRKKTYGHFSLAEFRRAQIPSHTSASENAKARRRRAS